VPLDFPPESHSILLCFSSSRSSASKTMSPTMLGTSDPIDAGCEVAHATASHDAASDTKESEEHPMPLCSNTGELNPRDV